MAKFDSIGIGIAIDDVFFNLVTKDTQLMKSNTPCRRNKEKNPVLFQLLIESTTRSAT